jgi:hypothetical protein
MKGGFNHGTSHNVSWYSGSLHGGSCFSGYPWFLENQKPKEVALGSARREPIDLRQRPPFDGEQSGGSRLNKIRCPELC